jgi:hypothetical protein
LGSGTGYEPEPKTRFFGKFSNPEPVPEPESDFLRTQYPNRTVGNKVDEIPGSDSSKSGFSSFYSTVNTPTKKKPHQRTPCYLPIFWYLPSKSKLWRKCLSFLAAKGSTLEGNISSSVGILFRIYILIWKAF